MYLLHYEVVTTSIYIFNLLTELLAENRDARTGKKPINTL